MRTCGTNFWVSELGQRSVLALGFLVDILRRIIGGPKVKLERTLLIPFDKKL